MRAELSSRKMRWRGGQENKFTCDVQTPILDLISLFLDTEEAEDPARPTRDQVPSAPDQEPESHSDSPDDRDCREVPCAPHDTADHRVGLELRCIWQQEEEEQEEEEEEEDQGQESWDEWCEMPWVVDELNPSPPSLGD